MLPAKTLVKLAFKAHKASAPDEANALFQLALAAADADLFFNTPDMSLLDKEHAEGNPVPQPLAPSDEEKGPNSLTDMLTDGVNTESCGVPSAPVEQTGFQVKGIYGELYRLAALLDKKV